MILLTSDSFPQWPWRVSDILSKSVIMKQVSLVLLGFRLNASVFSSEGRETRTFDLYGLKIAFHGTEIGSLIPRIA